MKLAEYLEDLDPILAGNLERALDSVRENFEGKIKAAVERTFTAAREEAAALASAAPQDEVAPAAPAAVSLDAADELRLAARDIDTSASQSEILEALSRGVLRFASRVAIFVNRGKELHGWSATGFGDADRKIKEVSLGGGEPFPILDHLQEGSVALSSVACASICDPLGAEHPSMGLILPFVLGNQTVGMVYCDRLAEETFSVSALQLLTYVAGQTLETLPIRKRESTATLSLTGAGTADSAVAVPAAPEAPIPIAEEAAAASAAADLRTPAVDAATEPATAISEPGPADQGALPAIDEETTRPGSPIPEAPPPADTAEAVDAAGAPPSPRIEPPAEPTGKSAPSPPPSTGPTVGLSSTQVAPPTDLQGPGWAFTSGAEPSEASSESEHDEAQRLARLLVTEIKLYNEEAVEEGRRDADVYSRLREDIDRSRRIFEDRIDPEVRSENDYFKQALVRILAGGDPALLGI
ncbi:MAG: hypothetical protein IH936_07905 [Acidobacteria bacterium]|nr:hypothetical protein [Acidobacteriota bacterium]